MRRVLGPLMASAALGVVAVGCGGGSIDIGDIPIPPQAAETTIDGSYEVPLDLALVEILSNVPGLTDGADELIFSLPDDTTIDDILGFYEAELDDGFELDGGPVSGNNNERAVWRHDGQTFVAAVIDAGEDAGGEPIRFLSLLLSV